MTVVMVIREIRSVGSSWKSFLITSHRTLAVFIPLMRRCIFHLCAIYGISIHVCCVYSHVCIAHDNGLYDDRPFMYIVCVCVWAWVGDEVERKISILNLRLGGLRIIFSISIVPFRSPQLQFLDGEIMLSFMLVFISFFRSLSPFYRFNFSLRLLDLGNWIYNSC